MKQKLVIRTNVKPVVAAQSVSYEWHWRRIWAVLVSFGVVIGAGIYALQLSVNADEVHGDTHAVAADSLTETVSIDIDTAYSEASELETNTNKDTDTHLNLAADSLTEMVSIDIDTAYSEASELETNVSLAADSLTETVSIDVDAAYNELSEPVEGAVSQKQFAQDATIANVARGAKIDTAKISRAVLTSRVVDREPVDVLKSDVSTSQFNEKIYFFTEIKNLQGNVIHHLWYYQDALQADITLTISAARYRTYSLKHVSAEQLGDWRVEAVTETGDLLAKKEFRIHAAKP
jgi:hypothetical protein